MLTSSKRVVAFTVLCSSSSNWITLPILSGFVKLHSWLDTRSRAGSEVKLKIWEIWSWSQITFRNWACSRVRFVDGFTPVEFRLGTLQTPTSSKMSFTSVEFNWRLTWMKNSIFCQHYELKYFYSFQNNTFEHFSLWQHKQSCFYIHVSLEQS